MTRFSKFAILICVAVTGLSVVSVVVGQRAESPRAASQRSRTEVTADNCLVALVEERNVPAEEAGVLVRVNVKEGSRVTAFQRRAPRLIPKSLDPKGTKYPEDDIVPLAEVDKSLPLLQKGVAAKEYTKAFESYQNDVSVRYADAQMKVAKKNYERGLESNLKQRGSISDSEIEQRKLEWDAGKLRIEQAEHDQKQAELDAGVKEAELANAEQALDHRDIHSPINGYVVQIYVQQGEWVKPGDPVFRIINLDKLRIQANLNIADCDPNDVRGRAVTVTTKLTSGEEVPLPGRVVFVHPEIKAGGRYSVWAEVQNKQTAGGEYVLWPGMKTTMTIDLTSQPQVNENARVKRGQ